MSLSIFARVRSAFVLAAIALSLALVPQVMRPALVAASPAHQTTTVARCGVVTYNTTVTPNTLQIGAGPVYQIASGATFTVASGVTFATGQNVCAQLTLNASNQITAGTVTANTSTTRNICGVVTAYMPSVAATSTSAGTPGSITIATTQNGTTTSTTFAIAPGATATNTSGMTVGVNANLCFQFTLNGLNQVTNAVVTRNTTAATGPFQICGAVTAYRAASAPGATTAATGTITIAGQTLTIAAGVAPTGTAIPTTLPAFLCVTYTLNAAGQVASLSVTPGVQGVSFVCSSFVSFTAATGTTAATIRLSNGLIFPVNTTMFAGASSLAAGQMYCFLLSQGTVVGLLTQVPTAITHVAASDRSYRVGGHWYK